MSAEPSPKPRFVRVTEPAEIAALERNLLDDPIGGQDATGQWWAYAWSLDRYRVVLRNRGVLCCPNCGTPTPNGGECPSCYVEGTTSLRSVAP